jgi:hypothetical protein
MDGVKPKYKWIVFATLAALGGIYFTGVSGSYFIDYLKDTPNNPNRNEYLEGVRHTINVGCRSRVPNGKTI